MNRDRFESITVTYPRLRLALVGDFCLDRYLEIDPAKREKSIETALAVHNVVRVRSQPGGAGTILNNLVALGIGEIIPVGFAGEDGEGYELMRALKAQRGVNLEYFIQTRERRTFTYCKPLLVEPGKPPVELNRFDSKNWTPTPESLQAQLIKAFESAVNRAEALILLEQVDQAETGVLTTRLLEVVRQTAARRPGLFILADSRRGLGVYPPVCLKMNATELARLTGESVQLTLDDLKTTAARLARQQGRPVFVTLSERGLLGATPDGQVEHVPALPVHGEIDIVGAGDAVTANLAPAMAAGATLREALEMANAAASIVIHQLGTTGTADIARLRDLLASSRTR